MLQPHLLSSWLLAALWLLLVFMPAITRAEAMPEIQFSIKPRLCVLAEGEEVCRDLLEIRWESPSLRSICLHRRDMGDAVQCWHDAHAGAHYLEIQASANIEFYLQEIDSEDTLVAQAFEVVHDNKAYRRRKRNPWSFF